MTIKEDGIIFKITSSYKVTMHEVKDFDRTKLPKTGVFLSQKEIDRNPLGYATDGKQMAICAQIRVNIIDDLKKLGYKKGCPAPENAYYLVYGQPSLVQSPETLYYEIEKTFDDMGWEFTGCPHHTDNLK